MASWSAIARRVRVPLGFVFALIYFWLARPTVKSILIGAALVIPGLVIRARGLGPVEEERAARYRRPLCLHPQSALFGFTDPGDRVRVGIAQLVDRGRDRCSFLRDLSPRDSRRRSIFARALP